MTRTGRIVCIGGATVDRKYRSIAPLVPGTSNPVTGQRGFGGVARNVAENLARLGVAVSLVTAVGDDDNGRAVLGHLRDLGVDVSQAVMSAGRATAEYIAVLGPDGDLALGLADMAALDGLTPAHLARAWAHMAEACWVFADCNLPAATLADLVVRRRGASVRLAVDAVSSPKAARLPDDLSGIDLLFLNRDEARAVLCGVDGVDLAPETAAQALLARGAGAAVLTLGAEGCVVATPDGVRRLPAVPARPVDVSGAGDAMIAGTLFRRLAGEDAAEAARTGALLAALTVECEASVHQGLSAGLLADTEHRLRELAG